MTILYDNDVYYPLWAFPYDKTLYSILYCQQLDQFKVTINERERERELESTFVQLKQRQTTYFYSVYNLFCY